MIEREREKKRKRGAGGEERGKKFGKRKVFVKLERRERRRINAIK